MAKKRSNLCLNRKKGHHYVPKQPRVTSFNVVSQFKSPQKTPISRKKRSGLAVFSPYKSPFSKRPRTLTPQKSPFVRESKVPYQLNVLQKDGTLLRTRLKSELIGENEPILQEESNTASSSSPFSMLFLEGTPNKNPCNRNNTRISKSLTFSSYGESILDSCFKQSELEDDIYPIVQEEENITSVVLEEIDNTSKESLVESITELIPKVIEKLQSSGVDSTFIENFFKEVLDETFPLNNISFLLWLEVIEWYNNDCTSAMRYSEDTKKFWKLGWRHFGGRFIRFMSGFKNTSQLQNGEAQRGLLKPSKSDINFAVPSVEVLRNYTPYGSSGGERPPGTFVDAIEGVAGALRGSSACISFDSKKLKQDLTPRQGDVNLLGFETGLSLNERKTELCQRLEKIEIKVLKALT